MAKRLRELKVVLSFIGLMWLSFALQLVLPIQQFGIVPREALGLIGVVTSPFLHANLAHISANTTSMLIFGVVYAIFKAKDTFSTIAILSLTCGLITWVIGRPATHIGASGLIFGLYGYLVARGWYSRKFGALVVSGLLVFLYGGIVFGVFPSDSQVSWEAHLAGFVSGIFLARSRYAKVKRNA